MSNTHRIDIIGARVHNLKEVSISIPRDKLIIFTGLSGSGKSSLAFDTIYAEGQRRYIESLSAYARQFLDQLDKPDVDSIEGLSPAISIDQKAASHNPRSTVGTITEIYDYIRLLFSSIGIPHCPKCGEQVHSMSVQEMVDKIKSYPENEKVLVLAPIIIQKKGEFKTLFEDLIQKGFSRVIVNNDMVKLTETPALNKHQKHTIDLVVDRITLDNECHSRLFQSIETALQQTQGLVKIKRDSTQTDVLFSESLSCLQCDISLEELSPRLFSFNSPLGACIHCNGLGSHLDFDADLLIEFPKKPIRSCTGKVINLDDTFYGRSAERLLDVYGATLDMPYDTLTELQKNILLYGQETAVEENPFHNASHDEFDTTSTYRWEGLITNLRRRYYQTKSDSMRHFFQSYMSEHPCPSCKGARLKPAALSVKIRQFSINDLINMSTETLLDTLETITFTQKELEITALVLKEIKQRLSFLVNVGLNYLTLSRKSGTLSGGEFQRIRLATQIGSRLTGVLYVLDEPSIGLHQRDNLRLIDTLKQLRDVGNTVIVVEHDEDTIRESDYVVDIGPGAGKHGGNVVFSGETKEFLKSSSLTAKYLRGDEKIDVPTQRRHPNKGNLTIHNAYENNLKSVTVSFPLGHFICVTGISGSGKSTLIHEILHKALMRHFFQSKERPGKHDSITGTELIDKVITITQSPIGKTPRSNPATYTGVFGPIRDLFSQTREAKIRGYKPGRFSFNVKGGRCESCEGDGVLKIEMHFLSDVYVTCDVCKGKRYNNETLDVHYKGHTISDILTMTVNDAVDVFENIPSIVSKLQCLKDVGLGYIALGQNATTLSGGESQRIKLAKELSKRSTGKTLYLLDEPTTGLHFHDIKQLLHVLHRLVDQGNTMIVIEHNLDVIKTADTLIDLGPEGGEKGGFILATGTPEDIAQIPDSPTGQFLVSLLPSLQH